MTDLNGLKINSEIPANFSLILAIVSAVVQVYAPVSISPILIGQYANTKSSRMEHNDIIESVLVRISARVNIRILLEVDVVYENFEHDVHSFAKDPSNERFFRLLHKKEKAIWFVDSISAFERLKADLLNERVQYERNGFFCIIYTGRERQFINNIHSIFRQLFSIFVININILISIRENVFIYTYFPFTSNECGDTKPKLYDKFGPDTKYNFLQRRFFSKKLLNMWGCKVRVTTWTEPPFMVVKYNELNGSFKRLEGIEGMMMMLLAKQMNFSIQIVEEPNHDRGYSYPNGTVTGTAKMLVNGETDIVVLFLMYDKIRQEISDPAYSYLNVPLMVGIPKGKRMTPFERLYRPFHYIIWSCLSFSFIFGIFVIFILKSLCNAKVQEFVFGQSNRIPFTNLWNSLFGGAIANALPRRNFARYLLVIWMLYTWLLRSAYIGQLFTIMQDSRARTTFSTIEEAIKRNFTFYTYPIAVPILQESAALGQINIAFVDNNENSVTKLFKRLGEDENANSAVTVLKYILEYHNQNPKHRNRHINILMEPVLGAPITFYMRKHSFLVFEINELLLNIMSAGLIRRFENLYLNKHTISNAQEPSLISVWLLLGLFCIYFCLILLSILVFLLELWSKYSRITKRVIDFFSL